MCSASVIFGQIDLRKIICPNLNACQVSPLVGSARLGLVGINVDFEVNHEDIQPKLLLVLECLLFLPESE